MARIRTIKPDYWKSEKLARRLPGSDGREARRLFVGLWNFAEDHGVMRGAAGYVRSELYPYDDDVSTADVARWLDLLERGGFIVRFVRNESTYLWIRGFREHQRIEKPSKSSLPQPTNEEMATTPGALPEPSPTPPVALPVGSGSGSGREVEGKGVVGENPPTPPPLKLEVQRAGRKPRRLSLQEQFYERVQAARVERLRELGRDPERLPDAPIDTKAINAALCFVSRETWPVWADAYSEFLDDKYAEEADPPFPMRLFLSQRGQFASRAEKRGAS